MGLDEAGLYVVVVVVVAARAAKLLLHTVVLEADHLVIGLGLGSEWS